MPAAVEKGPEGSEAEASGADPISAAPGPGSRLPLSPSASQSVWHQEQHEALQQEPQEEASGPSDSSQQLWERRNRYREQLPEEGAVGAGRQQQGRALSVGRAVPLPLPPLGGSGLSGTRPLQLAAPRGYALSLELAGPRRGLQLQGGAVYMHSASAFLSRRGAGQPAEAGEQLPVSPGAGADQRRQGLALAGSRVL